MTVAREHDDGLEALLPKQRNGLATLFAGLVGSRNQSHELVVASHEHDGAPLRAERVELIVDNRGTELPLFEQPMVADDHRMTIDAALRAAAVDRADAICRAGRNTGRRRMPKDRVRDRVIRPMFDRRSQRDHRASRGAVKWHDGDNLRDAAGERPRLVECDAADGSGPLEVRAAFDQNALSGGTRQRRDDGYRRRDHECARARDDKQHERAIQPGLPGFTERHRRHHRDADGKCDHRRRVNAREALDDGLRRRALRLRPLDKMNDSRKRRVPAPARDANIERAAAVDGAREHLIARRLVGGSDSPVTGA